MGTTERVMLNQGLKLLFEQYLELSCGQLNYQNTYMITAQWVIPFVLNSYGCDQEQKAWLHPP